MLRALADGGLVRGVARRMDARQATVYRWRCDFGRSVVEGLGAVAPASGRKSLVSARTVEAIMEDTLGVDPTGGSMCWSPCQMADRHGVNKDIVAQVRRERALRPQPADVFEVPAHPDFETKLTDIIDPYADLPKRAVMSGFDEKTQSHALGCIPRSLRPRPCRALMHDCETSGVGALPPFGRSGG